MPVQEATLRIPAAGAPAMGPLMHKKADMLLFRLKPAVIQIGVASFMLLVFVEVYKTAFQKPQQGCPPTAGVAPALEVGSSLQQGHPVSRLDTTTIPAGFEAIGSYRGKARDIQAAVCRPEALTSRVKSSGPMQFKTDKSKRVEYVKKFHGAVQGWCGATNAYMAARMSALQHAEGLFGAVGEIGVHHGKFFTALAHTADEAEPLFVCDIFEKQHLNVDGSGRGDRQMFLDNLAKFGVDPDSLKIYHGSSLDLTVDLIQQLGSNLAPFRMFSVDGGHTFDIALADMKLAACLLADGGIVILDDIYHSADIPAAMEHASKYNIFPRLRPFLILDNKLWYTTASHQEAYMNFAIEMFQKIVQEDAALGPQMIYAPQIAPKLFGAEFPIIAYVPDIYQVDGSPYTELRKRWLEFVLTEEG